MDFGIPGSKKNVSVTLLLRQPFNCMTVCIVTLFSLTVPPCDSQPPTDAANQRDRLVSNESLGVSH